MAGFSQQGSAARVQPHEATERALVIDADRNRARDVARVLRAVVADVDVRDRFSALEVQETWDAIAVGVDTLNRFELERLFTRFASLRDTGRIFAYTAKNDREDLVSLFGRYQLTKVLACGEASINEQEFLVTAHKSFRPDIFGLDKYMSWGARSMELALTASSQKHEVITACENLVASAGLSNRKGALLSVVAEELVTNALYDAPVDGTVPRHASTKRSQEVVLRPGEEVRVTLATDGTQIGISVCDPFGSLAPNTVVEYLAKCFRKGHDQIDRKDGGAGLGLYYTYASLSRFIVNIEQGKRTEFIGLIDSAGSFKDLEMGPRSLSVFVDS